jgi:hypothetical protein
MKNIEAITAVSVGIGAVILVIAYISLMPFAIIWALNTLFSLGIPFDFWSWLSAFVLLGALKVKLTN